MSSEMIALPFSVNDLSDMLHRRFPRVMRKSIGVDVKIEVNDPHHFHMRIRYASGFERVFTAERTDQMNVGLTALIDEIQSLEIMLRPKEAWEFHH